MKNNMKIVICPDSFKGTLTARRAAEIIKDAATAAIPGVRCVIVPMADGGEGTADALGAERVPCRVTGPYGDPVDSFFGVLGDAAVIELSASSGLTLTDRRDPVNATTRGAGELFLAAADRGFCKFILALGGSATNDCGCGMASACGVRFLDREGRRFTPVGGTLRDVASIDASRLDARLRGAEIRVMCDVDNPLFGPCGAAFVFAPQKGADEETVRLLDEGLRSVSKVIRRDLGVNVSDLPGAGAAGGCGAGALAFFCGALMSGADAVLDSVGFDGLLADADLCVSGEGRFDSQSARGKAVSAVAARAAARGVPVVVFCGTREDGATVRGVTDVVPIGRFPIPPDKIADYAERFLYETAFETFSKSI